MTNCFSKAGAVPVFLRKPIDFYDFPEGGGGPDARKPGVSDKVRHKPVCSATETY